MNEELIKVMEEPLEDEINVSDEMEDNINVLEEQNLVFVKGNYNELDNLPKINGVELKNNKSLEDLGIENYDDTEIRELIDNVDNKVDELENEIDGVETQVVTNTADIRQNKADISTLNDKVNNIHMPSKLSELINDTGFIDETYHDNTKQNTLVSGTNIKTVNNQSLLGSGNITIESGAGSYPDLTNKPKINNIELVGNKSLSDLGIQAEGEYVTNDEFNDALDEIAREFATNEYVEQVEQSIPSQLSQLTEDTTHRTVTDTEKDTWNNKVDYGSDLLSYMRRNSDQIYYPIIDGKPNVSIMAAKGYEQDRRVGLEAQNIEFTNFQNWTYYGIPNYVPLDLSLYNTSTQANMLHPYTQLPDGDYWVKNPGRIWLGNESYELIGREYIHKKGTTLTIWGGEYACAYYAWNATDEVYKGGFFTTYQDLVDYIAEQGFEKGYTITRQTTATGSIVINDGRHYKRVRETGVTSLTFSLTNNLGKVPDAFKARVTLRTATTFTTFNITQRDAYKLYFMGDDCANGVITGVANKYYDIEFKADGFGDVVGIVHSYELPTT